MGTTAHETESATVPDPAADGSIEGGGDAVHDAKIKRVYRRVPPAPPPTHGH